MRKSRGRFLRWLALGLALAALSASAAQARPDEGTGTLWLDTQAGVATLAADAQALRPDDRGGALGVGRQQVTDKSDVISRYLENHQAAVRPDDRGGIRGVGSRAVADSPTIGTQPSAAEYRAMLIRGQALNEKYGVGVPAGMTKAQYEAMLVRGRALNEKYGLGGVPATSSSEVTRPPDVLDAAGAARTIVPSQPSGFDWGDYAIGIGSGAGFTLLLAAGFAFGSQQRRRVQTA